MLLEIIRAVLLGALPVALFTFIVLQWSVASGRMNRFSDGKDLRRQYKDQAKAAKKAKKARREEPSGSSDLQQPFFHRRLVLAGSR